MAWSLRIIHRLIWCLFGLTGTLAADLLDKRLQCHIFGNQPSVRRYSRPSRPESTIFLSNDTAPFVVNGGALPFTDFHIGESYSGFLPIGDNAGSEYFFWFVPSTNPLAIDEVVIWLNGGPGTSSLAGFLHANGPFIWQAGTHAPVPNTYAWSNLTNVVWIDQPLGTGYSHGSPNVQSQEDVSRYFLAFWIHFVDLFQLQNAKIFLAGESYAGKYIPYLANAMIGKSDETYFNLKGILLFNPGIGDDMLQSEVPMAAFARANERR